jgi:hypothetical protein
MACFADLDTFDPTCNPDFSMGDGGAGEGGAASDAADEASSAADASDAGGD